MLRVTTWNVIWSPGKVEFTLGVYNDTPTMRLNCLLKNALVHFHNTCYPSSPYSRISSRALATNHTLLSNRLQLCVPFVGLVNCSSKTFFLICVFHDFLSRPSVYECFTDLRVFTTYYRGVLSSSLVFIMAFFITKASPKPI
jgi:hypothetical protein